MADIDGIQSDLTRRQTKPGKANKQIQSGPEACNSQLSFLETKNTKDKEKEESALETSMKKDETQGSHEFQNLFSSASDLPVLAIDCNRGGQKSNVSGQMDEMSLFRVIPNRDIEFHGFFEFFPDSLFLFLS